MIEKLQENLQNCRINLDQLVAKSENERNEMIRKFQNESIAQQSRIEQLESDRLQLRLEIQKYTKKRMEGQSLKSNFVLHAKNFHVNLSILLDKNYH